MEYTSIKRHQGKNLLWRRAMLGIVLFMVGLSLVFIDQGNVASAAPPVQPPSTGRAQPVQLPPTGRLQPVQPPPPVTPRRIT